MTKCYFPSHETVSSLVHNCKIQRCALKKLFWPAASRRECFDHLGGKGWQVQPQHQHSVHQTHPELTECLRKTSSCVCIKYLKPNTQTRSASASHSHLPKGISSEGKLAACDLQLTSATQPKQSRLQTFSVIWVWGGQGTFMQLSHHSYLTFSF